MQKEKLIGLIGLAVMLSACGGGGGGDNDALPIPPAQRGFEVLEYDLRDPITKQSLWTGYYCAPQVGSKRFEAVREDLYDIVYRPLRHYVLAVGQKFEVYIKVKTNTKDEFSAAPNLYFEIQPGITEITTTCEIKRTDINTVRIICDKGQRSNYDIALYRDDQPIDPPLMLLGNDGKIHAVISAEDSNTGHWMVTHYENSMLVSKPGAPVTLNILNGITYKNSLSVNLRFQPLENNRNTCPYYFQPVGKW